SPTVKSFRSNRKGVNQLMNSGHGRSAAKKPGNQHAANPFKSKPPGQCAVDGRFMISSSENVASFPSRQIKRFRFLSNFHPLSKEILPEAARENSAR
ncbi:MAG: hypothetical protein Q7U44_10335, partial [Desulfuromonadales bacterium]|nr:hypothetical protein [Desulfuromonadales bacterium]